MAFVDDFKKTFDAADFCETVKAGVGEGRITSNIALRDNTAVAAALQHLQDFAKLASDPASPDVVAAYVTYSPGAPEVFTALRAISVNIELVSAALECLTYIVKYSLDSSKPQQPLEHTRSIVKEIVKSRAVLIYDILATEKKACAKKALNLLRLVATCHPMLAKELINRFDLSAKSMAPSLCSITNNHCRVPFLDLMFVIIASAERDVLRYLSGKGREAIVTCLRTIQERAILEASGVRGLTKSILWKQGKAHHKKQPKVLPSHVQKRELVAAINFLLALEKHIFVGLNNSNRGALAHPVPTILAALAATDIPPLDVAPREVLQEHEALRSTATRMFVTIAKDSRLLAPADIARALNNPSLNFGTGAVVKFVSHVIQEKPEISIHILKTGRLIAAAPALTLRWFGYFSVIASCILRLQSPITIFREKQFFEKCLSHSDHLIRHFGIVLALSFCKVIEKSMSSEQHADDFLPSLEVIHKLVKPGEKDDDLIYRLIASYQSLLQKHSVGTDVKLMTVSVDAAGEDIMVAARTIEAALRIAPYSAVRKVVHKRYLSKLITKASHPSRTHDSIKLWSVCRRALRSTDLFQPGTGAEIDVYLSVLSSLGKDAEEPAQAFESMIAQALEMPYGLHDRLHSDEWSEERTTIRTSQMAVALTIKLQKLEAQKHSTKSGCEGIHLLEKAMQRMVLSVIATSSLLHGEDKPNSYLRKVLPSILKRADISWDRQETEDGNMNSLVNPRRVSRELLHDRGTYPKTAFLKLVEALATFHEGIEVKRNVVTYKAKSELGLVWDSWCDYWLSFNSNSTENSTCDVRQKEELSKERSDFLFRGVLRLLFDAHCNQTVETGKGNDPNALRQVLGPSDYRFAIALSLRTVEDDDARSNLYEEWLVEISDMISKQAAHSEESEFLYEPMLHSVTDRSDWNASQVRKILMFCISVMSRWGSLPEWQIHVAYSIALMKAFISHFSIRVAITSRAFLSTQTVDSLPPLTKLTDRTIKNLFTVLDHFPCLHSLAIAQVYEWSEREHRYCNGTLLKLLSIALDRAAEKKSKHRSVAKKLLKTFIKASVKSKTLWISNRLCEDDRSNLGALNYIARTIAQTRTLCELFLHRLFRTESLSRNSWLLLGTILESSRLHVGPEITNEELARLLSLIIEYTGKFSRFEDEYPEFASLQVLESVIRHLRERKSSFYGLISSADSSMVSLSRTLSDCVQARFSLLLSNSEVFVHSLDSKNNTDSDYITSLLACNVEILKLDLSLEFAAKEALMKLWINDGQFIRYCLNSRGTATSQDDSFPRSHDRGIQLISMVKVTLPWLSHGSCDHNLATSLSGIHTVLLSQLAETASSPNERQSSIRQCVKIISDYIRANDLQRRFPALLETAVALGPEAATMLNEFPKPLLEEAGDCILQSSYHTGAMNALSGISSTKNVDPAFMLHTFLRGCREALLQPQAPVLDLHRIAKDGILTVALTGTASTNQEFRALSFACLEAFATVVGPISGVSPGSASGLYKDRRQLAFLLELLRNSISDPLIQVLPLFAVWFRTATRIVLSPGHAANKLVATLLLRAPCLDVSDCYGLSHFLNCDASGSELQAIRLLAFDIIQKGVHSQRDVSVVRRRRIFDKIFMFAASSMSMDSSVRIAALKSLEAILNRNDTLDIAEELVGGHGIIAWLASDAKEIGETSEELFTKLNIIRSAAENFARRGFQLYSSILAEALTLFSTSRLKPIMTTGRELLVAERLAQCGALIAHISPRKRFLFRINFADIWIQYELKSTKPASFQTKQDFARCVCRQRDTVAQPDILEMLLEYTIHENECKNGETLHDTSMIHIFIAECLLTTKNEAKMIGFVTSKLCNLLAMSLYVKASVWLLVAAITVLDACGRLNNKIMACTDKLPAFLPQDLNPHFEQQFCSTIDEIRLNVVDELLTIGDRLILARSETKVVSGMEECYHTSNGIHKRT